MSVVEPASDLYRYCRGTAERAKQASTRLANLRGEEKNDWLLASADALCAEANRILSSNALDIQAAPTYGLSDASIDRLRLDEQRISQIAQALREIAALPDPIGETIEGSIRPNGLDIRKVRTPLGVVFFVYESRPNVTVDAAAICVKSGNAVILRGGKEAKHSSAALVDVMLQAARDRGLPEAMVQLVEPTDREAVGHFLGMSDCIDVAIPRGGKGLIERVVREASMPVIKHFDGNCHVYIDESAEEQMAIDVTVNSKCQRLGVCNAAESLLVHQAAARNLLPKLAEALREHHIEIRGDDPTCNLVPGAIPASVEDWSTEYLGPTISVRVVENLSAAVDHIGRYGSHHTDAIVTSDLDAAQEFGRRVDSSAVMINTSTRFNDGGMFGLGAEIGISTDKFHARGPCGLRELTTYKYIVVGNGQIRE